MPTQIQSLQRPIKLLILHHLLFFWNHNIFSSGFISSTTTTTTTTFIHQHCSYQQQQQHQQATTTTTYLERSPSMRMMVLNLSLAAVFQPPAPSHSIKNNPLGILTQAADCLRVASIHKIDLVFFPELYLTGGPNFHESCPHGWTCRNYIVGP